MEEWGVSVRAILVVMPATGAMDMFFIIGVCGLGCGFGSRDRLRILSVDSSMGNHDIKGLA